MPTPDLRPGESQQRQKSRLGSIGTWHVTEPASSVNFLTFGVAFPFRALTR